MPIGGTTYSGSADPYFAFHQLDRLQQTAQLLMQQAEERRERERKRLDERVKMAASAVAAGGDIASPAVQGVITDLRQTATKKWGAKEGYDKIADLLELNFKTQYENDPELIQQRSMAHVRDTMAQEVARYQATSGTGPGDLASQQQPPITDIARSAFDTAHGSGPVGFDAMLGTLGPTNVARMMDPEAFGHYGPKPPTVPGPTEAMRTREFNLKELESGDPQRVNAARRALGDMPDARYPPAADAGSTASTRSERDQRAELDDLAAGLKGEFTDRIAAWKEESDRHEIQTGGLDPAWSAKNPRPTMPNVDSVTRKVKELRAMQLDDETRAGLEEFLKQAALKGRLEQAWAKIRKRPEVVSAGSP